MRWKNPESGEEEGSEESGRGGKGGREGGGGGGSGAASQLQQVILPVQNEWVMEQLSQIFDRDRTKAKTFIEEVKEYLCLNAEVNKFYSPMKKMAFILMLIKGNDV